MKKCELLVILLSIKALLDAEQYDAAKKLIDDILKLND